MHRPDIKELPSKLGLVDCKLVEWGQPLRRPLTCARSRRTFGTLSSISGLLYSNRLVVDVKFLAHKDAHVRQSAIHAELLNAQGLLVNLHDGTAFITEAASADEIDRAARLYLALRNGRCVCVCVCVESPMLRRVAGHTREASESSSRNWQAPLCWLLTSKPMAFLLLEFY